MGYWNMTKLRISDINYPVMEYPFNSELHLWPKADVGVQWYHRDNFKTQRSRRKDDVVEVGELIELTLKYWGNTESIRRTQGKRRKTEETSTIEPCHVHRLLQVLPRYGPQSYGSTWSL